MNIPVLENLSLSTLEIDDAKSLSLHLNNRLIYRNTLTIPYPYLHEHALEFINFQKLLMDRDIDNPKTLGIRFKSEIVGVIGIVTRTDSSFDHQAEVGYWISEELWGKGLMSICLNKFLSYCFESFPLRKVFAQVFEKNIPSCKVLENNNFTKEGYLQDNIRKDGKFINCFYYGLIRSNHKTITPKVQELEI